LRVFVTSPWVPFEWIEAHGLEPCGVWTAENNDSPAVSEGICSFARTMAELGKAHPGSSIVFTTACDQMRRAADAAASGLPLRTFLFNLPATWQMAAARHLYHSEVQRLGKFLERLGGRAPSDAGLKVAMEAYADRRQQMRRGIRRATARQTAEALARYFCAGSTPVQQTSAVLGTQAVPLALVGGPLLTSQWPLFDAIEAVGGCVVLNATEPGERCLLPPLPADAAGRSPMAALADHYFDNIVDVFQRPNARLYQWLASRLTQRRVRGIVLWAHVGCDLWRAEAASLREAFGLPVLVLDAHEAPAGGLRDTNRLAAFIESLQ